MDLKRPAVPKPDVSSPAVPQSNLPPLADVQRTHRRARLGRPPGRAAGTSRPKEKVTLRLDAELVADYRDWSWDQRCQLGELVEQALRAFWTGRQVG